MTRPVKLPTFDYWGWASRLVKSVREGRSVARAVGSARAYARDVRDIDCVYEASGHVGRDAVQIRERCAVPVGVIKRWQKEAARDFGPGKQFTDRKLTHFLSAMFKEVHAAQIGDAVREADAQAAKAKARGDNRKASQWRRARKNLDAMLRSITDGGFVSVPYRNEYRPSLL